MAASVLIKVKSATFKAKAIVGAENATVEVSGSEQTSRGDGATTIQAAYVEGVMARVTVQALQGGLTDKDLINPGNGSLVIVGFTQADGAGQVGGSDKTYTFPNATLTSSNRGMPLNGNPSVNLSFTVADADGSMATLFTVV
jgi:hypothetical protein